MPAPENVAKELGSLLRAAQAQRLPSVSAAVVRKGEVLWADAVGYAGVEDEREATPETQYRIGSITKTFTATAIVQLREAGELGLDDPLSKHLPDAHHGQPTLRRMLAHLSGLQREPHGDIWESLESPDDAGLLAGLAHAEQVLEPAQAHHYSNLAFALLGHVVAARSGMPYRDYVDERIIRPLGLERTSWEREEPSALGYLVDPYANVAKREHDDVDLRGASAAGQLWSTTADLCRWAAFLAEGHEGVLAPGAVERMWFPQVMWDPDAWTLGWGLGLMLMRRGDRVFGGHGGGMPGHLSGVYVDRKSGIGGVALTNSGSNAEMDELAVALALKGIELLPDDPEPWWPEEDAPPELRGALGRWWSEGAEFVFGWNKGKLEARLATAPATRPPSVFEPVDGETLRTVSGREQGELLRLVRDEQGEIERMYWATYPFTRTQATFGP